MNEHFHTQHPLRATHNPEVKILIHMLKSLQITTLVFESSLEVWEKYKAKDSAEKDLPATRRLWAHYILFTPPLAQQHCSTLPAPDH